MIRKVITTLGIVLLAIGMFSCDLGISGPHFTAAQTALNPGNPITYTVALNEEVELATGVTLTDLKDKITLTHTPKTGGEAIIKPNGATIGNDNKTIVLTFSQIVLTAGDTFKIAIDANTVQTITEDKTMNVAHSITLEVKAAQ